MARARPIPYRFLFRGAVILGCFALVLGVAGIFFFRDRDRVRQGWRSTDHAVIRVAGRATADLVVRVHWEEADGRAQAETGQVGPEPGTWLFGEAPEGVPVTVWIQGPMDVRGPRAHPAILTRGATFEILLAAEGAGP